MKALAAELVARGLDALILAMSPNVRYLTGFTGSNAMLLFEASGRATLFTDPRYAIQASRETTSKVRVVKGPLAPRLLEVAKRRKLQKLGFEKHACRSQRTRRSKRSSGWGLRSSLRPGSSKHSAC